MADYLQISLDSWVKVGEGGNGITYENPAMQDVILKVNNDRSNGLEAVKKEFDTSAAVGRLGLPTPAMKEIVRVGDVFGLVMERVKNKKSLSRICHDEPDRTEEMARLLAAKGKELFATPCDTSVFPSRKKQALEGIDKAGFVSKANRQKIRAYLETVPESTACSHGDFQPGNLIMSEGKCYWIDLGRFGYGSPMFDIGHLYQICCVYAPMKQVQDIFHMTLDQFHRFWDAFAKEYTGLEDHSEFDNLAGKHAAIDVILRPVFAEPTFLEKLFFGLQVRKLAKIFF